MSDVANTVAATPTETPVKKSPVDELRSQYDTKGKVLVRFDAGETAFATFNAVLDTFSEADPLTDWSAKAPETFETAAIVHCEATDENRLIALPTETQVFADATCRAFLYNAYLRRALSIAKREDATEAQFVIVAGVLKEKFDVNAFRFQAKQVVEWFHDQGLRSIQVTTLRQALESQLTAQALFAKVSKAIWERVIGIMTARAEKAGYDTSLFTHWLATREVRQDLSADLDLDAALGKLEQHPEELDDAEETDDVETAPETATATA